MLKHSPVAWRKEQHYSLQITLASTHRMHKHALADTQVHAMVLKCRVSAPRASEGAYSRLVCLIAAWGQRFISTAAAPHTVPPPRGPTPRLQANDNYINAHTRTCKH